MARPKKLAVAETKAQREVAGWLKVVKSALSLIAGVVRSFKGN